MTYPINVGIIGTGNHGSRYANHITQDLKHLFILSGISRSSAQKGRIQARQYNTSYYADFSKLIADPKIEAIISVTPPYLNPEIAKACCRHNKKLLLEKPLATSLSDAEQIVESFDKAGLGLTIAQTLRYNPVIQSLRNEFTAIGQPYSFSATHRLEPSTIAWLEDPQKAGGGVIFHTAVHLFDALRYITGFEIKGVHATAYKIHNPNLEDLFTAQIEMDHGLIGIVESSKVTPARSARYEFTGNKGQLQGDQIHGFVQCIQGMEITDIVQTKPQPALIPLLCDWYEFITGNGANPIPGQEGLAAVRICNACRTSSATQGWVAVD